MKSKNEIIRVEDEIVTSLAFVFLVVVSLLH